MNRRIMAKWGSLLMVVTCLFAGCAKQEGSTTKKAKPTESTRPSVYVSMAETETISSKGNAPSDGAGADPSSASDGTGSSDNGVLGESTKGDGTSGEASETSAPSGDYLTNLLSLKQQMLDKKDYYNGLDNVAEDTWCFQRKKDHEPSGSYEYFNLKEYGGYYINDHVPEGDKVVYLTFDCGYPSNRTVSILDTLKKHNVKASFFVTKMYLEECSDYAIRMKEEGHMVCNHTVNHKDLTVMEVEDIISEIFDVAQYFYEKTGYEIDPYFRTPTGSYTKRVMQMIKDAGYTTLFWSLAYDDYDQNNQPAPGFIIDHFQKFHHNGAVILMHNDSSSNERDLDEVLTYLEGEGYRFGLLDEIA